MTHAITYYDLIKNLQGTTGGDKSEDTLQRISVHRCLSAIARFRSATLDSPINEGNDQHLATDLFHTFKLGSMVFDDRAYLEAVQFIVSGHHHSATDDLIETYSRVLQTDSTIRRLRQIFDRMQVQADVFDLLHTAIWLDMNNWHVYAAIHKDVDDSAHQSLFEGIKNELPNDKSARQHRLSFFKKAVESCLADRVSPAVLCVFRRWYYETLGVPWNDIGKQPLQFNSICNLWERWPYRDFAFPPLRDKLGGLAFERKLGNSRLTETIEIASQHLFRPGMIFLGRTVEEDVLQLGTDPNRVSAPLGHAGQGHALVVADTRFGKLVRIIQPTVGTWPGSLVALDNSGELASLNAERRGGGNSLQCDGLGQDVFVVDPDRVATVPEEVRACWNPLDSLDRNDPQCIKKSELIAEALIPDENAGGDQYWNDEGRDFIAALLLHVATAEEYVKYGKNNLYTVYQLMTCGDVELFDYLTEQGNGEEASDPLTVLFDAMKCELSMDYVSTNGRYLADLCKHARKQWEGIRGKGKSVLGWVQQPNMRAITSASNFSFMDLKTNPSGMSVFISLRDMSKQWRWVRILMTVLTFESETFAAPSTGHSTLLVLDEFPKLKAMPVMLNMLDCMAKYHLRIMVVCQSLDQLESVYPKDWHRFWSAADIRWFFGAESHKVRSFLEKELGQTEIIRLTRSASHTKGVSHAETSNIGWSDSATEGSSSGTSDATTWSKGGSDSTSNSWSKTKGKGDSYKESLVGLIPGINQIPFLKGAQINRSRSKQNSGGSSHTDTFSNGGSHTTNFGTNQSHTAALNSGYSVADTHNEQFTNAVSEQIHKGPVIEAAEFPKVLAPVDDPFDPRFPGQALVSIRGGIRFIVRTVRYYEDPVFYRTFGKHPSHNFVQTALPYHVYRAVETQSDKVWQEMQRRAELLRLEQHEKKKQHWSSIRYQALKSANQSLASWLAINNTVFFGINLGRVKQLFELSSSGRPDPTIRYLKHKMVTRGSALVKLSTGHVLLNAPDDGTVIQINKTDKVIHVVFSLRHLPVSPKWINAPLEGTDHFDKFRNLQSIGAWDQFVHDRLTRFRDSQEEAFRTFYIENTLRAMEPFYRLWTEYMWNKDAWRAHEARKAKIIPSLLQSLSKQKPPSFCVVDDPPKASSTGYIDERLQVRDRKIIERGLLEGRSPTDWYEHYYHPDLSEGSNRD